MNFLLSEDQVALQAAVRDYAVSECDRGARRAAFESAVPIPEAFWPGLMTLGAGGIGVPAEFGGMGLDLIDVALAAEALGYAGAPGPFIGHAVAALAILRNGSAAQKEHWLPRLASGEVIATVALSEASSAHDPQTWQAHCKDGRLIGAKFDSPSGPSAGLIVVGTANGFALVEGSAGTTFTARDGADRTRPLWHLDFGTGVTGDAMPASVEARQDVVDAALVLLAADAFGGARRCLDMAADYARTREQFGGPIGRFQAVKHQLADLAVDIEPTRGLYWYAAYAYDAVPQERARMAATAKAHLGDVFMQAARRTIELHGGIGYTWDYDAQIWFKRAMFDFAWLGSPTHHRERAARLSGW